MGGERETVPLGEIYDFSSGLSKPRSEFGSGYPFLAFKDVFYSFLVPKELSQLVNATEQERTRCSVRRGDVFLTRTSETMNELGMSCVALCDIPNATFNGFTKRLRPKIDDKVVPEYAGYYFRSAQFRQSVTAMSSMSTRASLNNEMLARLSIDLPPLQEQVAIGHILGTLDDKIELNRRMSETLEAMARALFKSWFVDFDPVRAKMAGRDPGLPKHIADLFPARLVDSELGETPEGWEEKPIGDVVQVVGGSTPSTKVPDYWDGEYHWTTPKDLSGLSTPVLLDTKRRITEKGLEKISSGLLPIDTLLLSSRAPVGYLAVAKVPIAVNQGYIAIPPENPLGSLFLLYWCDANMDRIKERASGTTFQEISKTNFRPIPLVVPSKSVIEQFNELVGPVFERIVSIERESRLLAIVRDTLLPKLISGELRLNGDRELLKEVAS